MLPSLDASDRNNDFISSCQQLNGIFFFFLQRLPFAASEVILFEPGVLGPRAGQHLGTLAEI